MKRKAKAGVRGVEENSSARRAKSGWTDHTRTLSVYSGFAVAKTVYNAALRMLDVEREKNQPNQTGKSAEKNHLVETVTKKEKVQKQNQDPDEK